MKQGQLLSHKEQKWTGSPLTTASSPGGIKEGGCEKHTLKLSGTEIGEYLYDLRVETDSLNKTQKAQIIKEKEW